MPTDAAQPDHCAAPSTADRSTDTTLTDDRREHDRNPVVSFRSNVGVILDASDGGLRVRGVLPKGSRPGRILAVTIENESGTHRVEIAAEIRWIQRQVFRGATFGVAFIAIDEEQRATLFSIIRTAETGARCSWTPC